jgi:hypothetical protein
MICYLLVHNMRMSSKKEEKCKGYLPGKYVKNRAFSRQM